MNQEKEMVQVWNAERTIKKAFISYTSVEAVINKGILPV